MPPSRLEEYRKILPPNQFKSEYLGEFLDDDGTVFTNFKDCVGYSTIEANDKLIVGIDWSSGGGGDDTVITVLTDKGKQVILEYFNISSVSNQIERIARILRPLVPQIKLVKAELNSIGTPFTEMLRQKMPMLRVEGFLTTNKSKADIIGKLQVAFENREITLIDDEKQMKELGAYAMDFNPRTKVITYNAPNGMNDDICMALAICYDGYKQFSKFGSYSISIL